MSGHHLLTLARLTFLDLRRRLILAAAFACGGLWLLVFAIAAYVIHDVHRPIHPLSLLQARIQLQLLTVAGLYAANLLCVLVAIMLPLDCLSGEIGSGVMQTLASKPVRRSEIVLSKWLVFLILIAAYIAMLVTGVLLAMYLITGYVQPHAPAVMALMLLEATVVISVVIAGGVRFTTVTNGLIAFALYSIAVVGGLIEQIGTVLGSTAARHIGTLISLLTPTDALWRRALYLLHPPVMSPFAQLSVPSEAMVWWSAAYAAAVLALALVHFEKREL